MKRLSVALFLLILSASTVQSADTKPKPALAKPEPAKPVPAPEKKAPAPLFADKALEAAVREDLKKGEKEDLKEDDLSNLYFLHGANRKIKSLAGLEKCVNVESLELAGNEIVDLKPLSPLVNVQTLDLRGTRSAMSRLLPPW